MGEDLGRRGAVHAAWNARGRKEVSGRRRGASGEDSGDEGRGPWGMASASIDWKEGVPMQGGRGGGSEQPMRVCDISSLVHGCPFSRNRWDGLAAPWVAHSHLQGEA